MRRASAGHSANGQGYPRGPSEHVGIDASLVTAVPESLSLIDALLILIALAGMWGGWRKGFLLASLQLLVLAASVAVSFFAYSRVAAWITAAAPSLEVYATPLGFLGTFIAAQIVLGFAADGLARTVPGKVHLHGINRALGTAPGLASGLLHAFVVALVLLTLPLFDGLSAATRSSAIASRLAQPAEWVEAQLHPIFEPAVRRTLQTVTAKPDSHASVQLPFKVGQARPRPDLEARMLEMVNQERSTQGLRPVTADAELVQVARGHSRDMLARGYFSHVTPDGKSMSDRMRAAGVRSQTAGENLALAQTLPAAHQGLMNSPGHRANILRPQFTRLGIGVLDVGRHGLMVTQNFRN
ncbi:MAG: hypothetical protein EOO25_05670 [Comamonadaceae bacterium]|nr:MAG: hypothetical protein EOO25_05670 [Comamonadaceae bacterium]